MASVAAEGDEKWQADALSLTKNMIDSAVFCTDGLGFQTYNGPTMMVPVIALDREQTLDAEMKMPSMHSRAGSFLDSESPPPADFFEGAIAPLDKRDSAFLGAPFKNGKPNGGPWMTMPLIAHAMANGATSLVSFDQTFKLRPSVLGFPTHFGSKHVETLRAVAVTMLPLTNFVASFEPNLKNVDDHKKSSETWDARLASVDVYTALGEHGILMDTDMVLEMFKTKPLLVEEKDVAALFTSQPKSFLTSGFALLNESNDARNSQWLKKHVETMNNILKKHDRQPTCELEMRAIDARGFEEHKASYAKLDEMELEDRVGEMDENWLVYAVLKIDGVRAEFKDLTTNDDDDEQPVANKTDAPGSSSNHGQAKPVHSRDDDDEDDSEEESEEDKEKKPTGKAKEAKTGKAKKSKTGKSKKAKTAN